MEISTQLVEIDGVPQMFAVSTDVTARIEAELRAAESEARQKKAEDGLAHAQKLESLGRLTGGIAHDFNNLLAVILTHASFLAEDLAATDPRRSDALAITAACERAAALTKQLLAFSRRQHLTLSAIEPSAVVANLAHMLQRLIGEDIELAISSGNVGTVRGDVSQLEQVIVNLVVNARDAMPDGGALSVEVARTAVEAGVEAGEWVVVSVRDTGCGMSEETKARLFEPFYTTKEWGKGTGLGLSTSYGIVKQFGGHILVESELGKGTVVKVLLPSVALEVVEPTARPSGDQCGCETVLLVEDDRAVRAALGRVLGQRGYDVVEAGSLGEAVDRARAHPRAIDLVICDVVMPGGHGTGVMDRLAEVAPQARVLLMSGYTDHALLDAARVAGQGFLQKPFAPEVLAQKVRDVLGGVR
jgi:signal transduction histidine kinase